MDERRMNNADFITSLVLIVFGVGVMAMSAAMPDLSEKGINPYTAPGVVPFLLGAIITGLAAVLLIRSILRKGWDMRDAARSFPSFVKGASFRRIMATAALTLVYGAVMVGRLNYIVSTVLFIFAFIFVFEYHRGMTGKELRKLLLVGAIEAGVTTAAVTLVFQYLFLVDLP